MIHFLCGDEPARPALLEQSRERGALQRLKFHLLTPQFDPLLHHRSQARNETLPYLSPYGNHLT